MEKIKNIISNKSLQKYQKLSAILKYLFIDIAKIAQDKYFLIGSFGLREHRKISDLDIVLDYDEFLKLENLVKEKLGILQFYNGQIRWFLNLTDEYNKLTNESENDFSIEAFQKKPDQGFPDSTYCLSELTKNKCLDSDEYGHQFFSLKTLLKWKKQMNRDKDKADIELIENLLKKGASRKLKKTSRKNSKIKKTSKLNKKSTKKSTKKSSKIKKTSKLNKKN